MRGLNILHDRENDLIGFTVPSETCFGMNILWIKVIV